MNEPIRMHTVDVQLNRMKSERENEECSSRKMVENFAPPIFAPFAAFCTSSWPDVVNVNYVAMLIHCDC